MRQASIVVAALLTSGCNSILGIEDLSLRADASTNSDSAGEFCYGSLVRACTESEPSIDEVLPATLDTSTSALCTIVPQASGDSVCAIIRRDITVPSAGTSATGSRPLMLVATRALRITGKLDVGSRALGQPGAGSNPAVCGLPPMTPMSGGGAGGGGGGAGGSFGAKGGKGGNGAGGGSTMGAMALAPVMLPLAVLRGGCPGANGGHNNGGLGAGPGGSGGGAVYLVSPVTITITGQIWASGAGGRKTTADHSGGGGGGSGGMIVLQAPMISLMSGGSIAAHGGGGAAGEDITSGGDGQDNEPWDGTPDGGTSAGNGGAGGDGGHAASAPAAGMDGGNASGGGGGGGGGGGQGLLLYRGAIGSANETAPSPITF